MKIQLFASTEKLNEALSDEDIIIKRLLLSPSGDSSVDDCFYLLYEDAEDQLAKEKDELSTLDKVAQELEKDDDYGRLKNSTQRSLYLLTKYSIPNGQATKVIELVNMKKIVEIGLARIFEKGVESGEIKVE